MTKDEVNAIDRHLHDAERDLESAGQKLCNEHGAGAEMWHEVNRLVRGVQDLIHKEHLLRRDDDGR